MIEKQQAGEYLKLDEIKGVQPLDLQFGVWQKKCIPDELYPVIFGDIESTEEEIDYYSSAETVPELKTYALLEGAKIPHLSLLLENSDLPYKSLFKGKAETEYKDVAAYLVELKESNDLTRDLFTSSKMPSSLWDNNAAVYLRSRKSMNEIHHHLRKFTRLYSEKNQQWMLFRFYAPEVLSTVISAFDEKQFETFAKGIRLLACRTNQSNFLILTRAHEGSLIKLRKIA